MKVVSIHKNSQVETMVDIHDDLVGIQERLDKLSRYKELNEASDLLSEACQKITDIVVKVSPEWRKTIEEFTVEVGDA